MPLAAPGRTPRWTDPAGSLCPWPGDASAQAWEAYCLEMQRTAALSPAGVAAGPVASRPIWGWREGAGSGRMSAVCPSPVRDGAEAIMLDRSTGESAEVELLRRIGQRDGAALGELYDRMAGVLFGTALQILADRREAEEVVQDVFLQIWNKAGTFDATLGTALNWTIRITRNRCIDCLRSRLRRSRLLDEVAVEAELGARPHAAGGGDTLGAVELEAVRAAVASLPPDQHQAVAMAFFGGMTHPEIAEALHEPLGTVKARIRRGMLKLRDGLEAYV